MRLRLSSFSLLFLSSWLSAADLHVAVHGVDTNAGTEAEPLASLFGARDAIRKMREGKPLSEPITVWVHGGVYDVNETLLLEPKDSGTDKFPITYRAYGDDIVQLYGAPKVTGFEKHETNKSPGEILKADVSALGLKDLKIRQLLLDGERQQLARHPNFDPANPYYGGWSFLEENPEKLPEAHAWKRNAYIKPNDRRQWAYPEDVEIDVYAYYGWWNWIMPVQSLDPQTGLLTLAKDCGYDLHPHNRYYFQNALEELDAPGEWFLDKRTQTLYFWPPKPLDHRSEVRIPKLNTFIKLASGTKHITIRGLRFTGCTGNAILLENTDYCTIAACTVTQVGGFSGTGISLHAGTHNRAVGNNVSYTGSGGISVGGGDRKSLRGTNNSVDNNHIHHVGVINKNGPGVGLTGVGNSVTHNLIHHTPRMAVQFSGNNLTIEYNHMHHTVLETQDGGAVYTGGRDWLGSRGTKLRYNHIHDTIGLGQDKNGLHWPHFTWGIYMDDNAGGVDITHNVIARSARAGLHLHNGRDHLIENNIFIDGGERQVEFNGWNAAHAFYKSHLPTMIEGWDSIKDRPEWKGMRNIELDPRNAMREDGTMMSGNVFQRNIIAWSKGRNRYLDIRHFSTKYNSIERNLVWAGGEAVRTAVSKIGPDKSEELLSSAELLRTTAPGKTPKGWGWNHRPLPTLQITATDGIVSVPAATGPDPKNVKSVIHLPSLPFKPGGAFRARFKVRSTEASTRLGFAFGVYANPGGYFATQDQTVTATTEWQDVEVAASFPGENETRYKPWMKSFWLRMDIHAEQGTVQLKDITLHEAEPSTDWAAWQEAGWDKGSLIANPSFVNPASDDYRLNPDSPASKIGFEAIPYEKIGLYPSELRAR